MINDKYKFTLPALPYPYDSLEPYIDTETMHLHHDKHFATYVDNLNKVLENYPAFQNWTLFELVRDYSKLPPELQTPVKNNTGGVYNHYLYFQIMTPGQAKAPYNSLGQKINSIFGSYQTFKDEFKKVALGTFGSGYTWLTFDTNGTLDIVSTPNQDTSLPMNKFPVLLIDVWEHAYYLKYHNLRSDYIDSWFNLINWEIAENNYLSIVKN